MYGISNVVVRSGAMLMIGVILFLSSVFWLDLQQGYFTDQAQILSAETEDELTQQLRALEKETGAQVVVVTIDDLEGRDPFEVAFNLAQYETDRPDPEKYYKDGKTGVWDKDRDNGLLLLIAPNDRKWYAVTGRWLEWPLPDVYVKRLWEGVLVPAFRVQDYDGWVNRFVEIVDDVVRGEYEWMEKPYDWTSMSPSGSVLDLLITGIFLAVFFGGMIKPAFKTKEQKYRWSGVMSCVYAALSTFAVGNIAWVMILPLFVVWLFILLSETVSSPYSTRSWWFSGWWSFGWGFGWFGWWSFGGWWAWWSR